VNEVVIYEELKKKMKNKTLDRGIYSKALMLFIMKKALKLCSKIILLKKKSGLDDNEMELENVSNN
jgi:hypothetical protein